MSDLYRELIEESHTMRNDALMGDEFSWNGEDSIGGDFDSYMDTVQNNRQNLHNELLEVKSELQRQFTKLKEAKVEADYSLRESIDAGLKQIDEARRKVKRALQELENEPL